MLFYSKHANMTFLSVGGLKTRHKRHPVTGDILETTPRVDVVFGKLGPEQTIDTPDGQHLAVDIVGHYYDTDIEAETNHWDADTKEMVERHLLRKCEETPEFISLVSESPAPVPWPTYDKLTNYLEIAKLAEDLGLLQETLRYERQNKNRDGVVKALSEKLQDAAEAESLVAA